ncbi:MAG: S8 family serine peptidase [Deltaproteobacteria bacterium]|nr:S8 family serine peptidase [Deltaproteobacteria bacterium]
MTTKRIIPSVGKSSLILVALAIGLGLALFLFKSPIELGCSVAADESSGAPFRGYTKIVRLSFVSAMTADYRADIIVLLKDYQSFADENVVSDTRKMARHQAAVRSLEEKVISAVPSNDFSVKRMYRNFPGLAGTATLKGIKALAAMDEVAAVEEDEIVFPHLRQGIPLIKADKFQAAGYRGVGVAVAIVDTGVDYTHPKLGGGNFPNAKVIGGYNFGDLNTDPMDCQGHGTACAGIAAGDPGDEGDYIGGIAPEAKIYALKIIEGCAGSAVTSGIADAWDWCVTHKNDNPAYPIMVISTSFGGSYYTSSCDQSRPTEAAAASSAVANGITLLVSSGNEGYCDGLAGPACISKVISVGAVYDADIGSRNPCVREQSCIKIPTTGCKSGWFCRDETTTADKVTCYSNSADMLNILAPSNNAYTTGLVSQGGYKATFGGTSAACPYAAGAAVLLQNYYKATTGAFKSPAEIKNELVATGKPIMDPKSGVTKPRVNLVLGAGASAKDGVWNARGSQNLSIYYQTYNNGGATCVASADGKDIIACYAASTTDQVFEGLDIPTSKTYLLRIDFDSSTNGTLTLTNLGTGKADTYRLSKQNPAQTNPLTDGVWRAASDSTHQFFFQTYVGGSALLLYTSNGVTAKVFFDNQMINDVFSGNDIYTPHQDKIEAKFTSAQSAVATITPLSSGISITWNIQRFSTAKGEAKARP